MKKTIIALDFSSVDETLDFIKEFDEPVYVKVGMELIYGSGFEIIREIKKLGHFVFLDLKLHDIPNTVKGGMKNLAKLGIDMVNVHASGGIDMMKSAKEGLEQGIAEINKEGNISLKRPLLIGVTQLTSTSQEVMNKELGIEGSVVDCVLNYAENVKKAGLDGVVCSVYEASAIHDRCGNDFLTVTPGIRLKEDSSDDQRRVATPELAKNEGCDFIVVGRSITKKVEPVRVYNEIEAVMSGK